MDLWKGNGVIKRVEELFDAGQFAPVFMVIDISNEGAQSAQIVRGYLDVEQSVTDLQPFLNIMSDYRRPLRRQRQIRSELPLHQFGLGRREKRQGDLFVRPRSQSRRQLRPGHRLFRRGAVGIGGRRIAEIRRQRAAPANRRIQVSFARQSPGLHRPAAAIRRSRQGGRYGLRAKPERADARQRPNRLQLDRQLGGARRRGSRRYSSRYRCWNSRFPMPPNAVRPDRSNATLKPLQLSLDRKNYRIALDYSGNLAPRQNRRFGLTLSAREIVAAPVQDHARAGGRTHDLDAEVRLALLQAEPAAARGPTGRQQSRQKLTRWSNMAVATAQLARRPCRSSAAG